MTLYRETTCPTHGGQHDPIEGICPGGSREEVTIDYEAAGRKFHDIVYGPADTLVAITDPSVQNGRAILDAALHTEKEPASTI